MTGEDLVALVPRVRPDVVILDMRMPKGDGLATLQALQKSHPDLKVIMLSMFDDPEHIEKALGYGAAGYVVKSINPLDLPSTIRGVFEGTVYHPRGNAGGGTSDAAPQATPGGLTNRELAILKLVAEGLSNLNIASKLFVTEQTVKFHLSNIYRKLGVGNRHRGDPLRLQERPDRLTAPAGPHAAARRARSQVAGGRTGRPVSLSGLRHAGSAPTGASRVPAVFRTAAAISGTERA